MFADNAPELVLGCPSLQPITRTSSDLGASFGADPHVRPPFRGDSLSANIRYVELGTERRKTAVDRAVFTTATQNSVDFRTVTLSVPC